METGTREGVVEMLDKLKDSVRWVLAPATEEVPHSHAVAAAALRILLGLMWFYNVAWKRAPDFGEEAENGLYKFTSFAVSDPVFPPYSWVVENLVLPNIALFGWGVLLAETALAVLLLSGAWVRAAALLGLAQSVAIFLSVAFAPHEWPWSYYLMIGAHGLLLFSSAGRVLAVDAVRAGIGHRRLLGTVWGGLAIFVGLVSVVLNLGDPLDARGAGLRSTDLSLGLGVFNLLGGLVLLVVGGLLLVAARGGASLPAMGAAGLAALAGLSLHLQLGLESDPLLGGTPTSAALLFTVGLVAVAVGRLFRRHPTRR